MPRVLLSIRDAAAFLGEKSPGSLYRKIKNQEILCVMAGKQRMVESEGLREQWEASRRRATNSNKAPAPSARADTIPPPQDSGPPTRKRNRLPAEPPADPTETPDYNEERAWHEREKRLIAELERRQKAGELVCKADVEQAQMAIALTLKNQLEALPKQVKQQLPHLSISDEEMIERLVAKVLTAVADWRMDQEEEE
jgi:hypothetical protein